MMANANPSNAGTVKTPSRSKGRKASRAGDEAVKPYPKTTKIPTEKGEIVRVTR